MRFTDTVAIVTGGGSGIGRATSTRLAADGASVVVADVAVDAGEETVAHIRADGGTAHFVHTDVTESESVAAMVAEATDVFGPPAVAINNAGIAGENVPTADLSVDDWDRVTDVNLKGVWLSLRHELPVMADHGGGAVVNTASISGMAAVGPAPYVASKHGVIGLTRVAATEYAADGVRVNAVCPGFIDTPLLDPAREAAGEALNLAVEAQPLSRLGEPEEIADAVAWLCSDEASFATGNAFPIDGGYLAR